jgi:hypothetical protein
VQRIRFLNPVMDSEFRRALEVLALSHDTQKKAVSLSFEGDGKRHVRVGYVVENPIWKTSYRLVLNKEGKPYLQGWAVVETRPTRIGRTLRWPWFRAGPSRSRWISNSRCTWGARP